MSRIALNVPRVQNSLRIANRSTRAHHAGLGNMLLVRMPPKLHVSVESRTAAVVLTGVGLTSVASCTHVLRYRDEIGDVAGTGNSECTDCAAAKYANMSGQSACESCDPGRYANETGSTDCYLCGVG